MAAKAEGRTIREAEYGRYGNPTQEETERKLAALEGADRAVLFSSGMSAVLVTLLTYLRRDEHIVFTSDWIGSKMTAAPRIISAVYTVKKIGASRQPWFTPASQPKASHTT